MTFTLTDFLLLGVGIFIGLIWGALIFIKRKKNLVLKHINQGLASTIKEEKKQVDKIINNVYSYHITSRRTNVKLLFGIINIKKKIDYQKLALTKLELDNQIEQLSLTKELYLLIERIAKIYYPNSEYPICELTIEELFLLIREIIRLISNVVYDIGIPNLEKLKVSTIKDLMIIGGKVKKVYSLKGVRITVGLVNALFKLQSIVTPIYWIKKGTNELSIGSLSQFLIKCMFEIVGKETAYIYSKNFINK